MTTETRSTSPLQATARWTAAVRAGERERPDRLVDDPWAADLAGPEGMAWLAGRPEGSVLPIVIRTRYFDDWLRAVAVEGPLRQVVLLGKSSKETHVREIMTHKVLCVRPDQTVDECMGLMTAKRVRHLPVLDHKKVIGVISIGDVVKEVISEQQAMIEQLEHYIHS